MKYSVTVGGCSFEIEVEHDRLVRVDGRPVYIELDKLGGVPVYSLALEDTGYVVFVEEEQQGEYQVEVQGRIYPVRVQNQRPVLSPPKIECADGGADCTVICAPLAGHLVDILVVAGDRVEAGQVVAVVESMKMQMELRSARAGTVDTVHRLRGQDVGQGEELVTIRTE
jgi:oxaloacetate decarboxylase alpha subunit